jgi:SLOG cluster3 family
MTDAIFLSAGVPDPKRGPDYAKTADTVAITAAVSALVHVTLGRRLLVWGGQPAITPMIWVVAEGLGMDYASWVKLYQSQHFKDEYPEDNQRFQNVTYTDDVAHDREKSLRLMRERMFSDFNFTAAVFIGGMGGIVQEFDLFRQLQPRAVLVPVISTGGAVLNLAHRVERLPPDLRDDLDYVSLFHRHLNISVKEMRYRNPTEQPSEIANRLWQYPEPGGETS